MKNQCSPQLQPNHNIGWMQRKTYTADYLLTDKTKRVEILEACKANKQSTENCTNANTAQAAINKNINAKTNQLNRLKYKLIRQQQK